MRLFLCTLLLFINATGLIADDNLLDFRKLRIPDSLNSVEQITKHLIEDVNTEKGRAKYIFSWVTKNIKYDPRFVYGADNVVSESDIVKKVLRRRKGVCQHYAILLKAMFTEADIESHVILGLARRHDGPLLETIHAWNAAKIDGEYLLLDPTFASGYVCENHFYSKYMKGYFLIEPKYFIETHIPFDPLFQFLDNPLSHHDFSNGDYDNLSEKGNWNCADTLIAEVKLAEYEKVERSNRRIMTSGGANIRTALYLEESIKLVSKLKYSHVVRDLTDQIKIYRQVLLAKKKNYEGIKEEDLRLVLRRIKHKLVDNVKLLNTIEAEDRLMNNLLESMKPKILKMIAAVHEEEKAIAKLLRNRKKAQV